MPVGSPVVPTFVGIGPGKSGTTWMYRLLREHPDVFVPKTKETLYFSDYFQQGVDWYQEFFRGAQSYRSSGEISNTYIFDSLVPERIHSHNPDMRIISSLRNPIDRAFSHYLWLIRNGEVASSFEDALKARPDLASRGLYDRHLSPYFDLFPRSQLLVLVFEDLRTDPRAFARRIFEFLDVDSSFFPEGGDEKILGAMRPRSRVLARAAKRASVMMREAGLPGLLTRIKESSVVSMLYRPIGKDEYPTMTRETRDRLRDYYRDDVASLSSRLGVDLQSRWLSPNG